MPQTKTADWQSLLGLDPATNARAIGDALARSIVALSIYNEYRRPQRIATGILLRVDGHHFLATAGHAVLATLKHHLWAGFDGLKLQRVPALFRQASRIDVDKVDDLDIGLLPLPGSQLGEFARGEYIDLSSLDFNVPRSYKLSGAPDCIVCGYSAARKQAKVDSVAKVLHQNTFFLRTHVSPPTAYTIEQLDPARHLLLNHNSTDVTTGTLKTTPKMHGVSGGGVIHWTRSSPPALVGIVTEHRKSNVIVATRIENAIVFARHMIKTSDPTAFA
jgi:hypothetical protein